MMQQNENATIPELEESESVPDYYEGAGYECEEEYTLDLGSDLAESACPTPTSSYLKRPLRRPPRREREKETERYCGICFEPATSPVRTLCCAHLFCAEHITQWLLGPAADGRCPGCRALCSFAFGEDTLPGKGLLALGHPALLKLQHVPRTPPPSRSPSPSTSSSSTGSYASYVSYPTSPSSDTGYHSNPSEPEEEDSTDYSLPALLRARALQTRRHTAHPFSSVLGARAATVRVLCLAGWVVVVAVLAGSGRWGTDALR
ncbi:hypothetical protein C8R44DRAFT_800186 [Mycena epipterygia]|nr:hypothetical protein C8R44DRAFT_800186 [Mycena epipterygia]